MGPVDHGSGFFRRLGVPTRPNDLVSNLPYPRGKFVGPVVLLKDPNEQFLEVDLFSDWFRFICKDYLSHLMDPSLHFSISFKAVPTSVQIASISFQPEYSA